ncbi:MAG: GNAT family N-acetyltransferase [Streptococcus pyogenes]|nr:MAG: GNAT family N-acetyltransferase [Streptococcus pyogenes]
MDIRLAFPNEINQILPLFEQAKRQMAAYGSDQWQDAYPDYQVISNDILQGQAYLACQAGEIIGYVAVVQGGEEAYEAIYEGQWLTQTKDYVVFHRLVLSQQWQGQGLAQIFLQGMMEGLAQTDFRCDTHEKNRAMQGLLEKLGFTYCGKIPLAGERLAYQLITDGQAKAPIQYLDEEASYPY